MAESPPAESTELVAPTGAPAPVGYSAAGLISDSEITSLWRIASSLAASGMFKNVTQAEQSFAKLIVGRDLGLTPAQSMTLYVMEGKIEVPYQLLGTFIRSRPGYDYSVRWLKAGEATTDADPDLDGCEVTFTVNGEIRGVSTWTKADTERAGLDRDRGSKTSNHKLYPRNLYLARCLSNGTKFHVPEVLNGLPVYAEGELPRPAEVGAGQGSGESQGWKGLTAKQAKAAEMVLARAKLLGHAGLATRTTVEMSVNGQAPPDIDRWIVGATATLDKIEAEAIPEADVVPEGARDRWTDTLTGKKYVVTSEPGQQPIELKSIDPVAEFVDAPAPSPEARADDLESRALDLLAEADSFDEDNPEHAEELRARAAAMHDEAAALRDPAQPTLPEM
jgi:hypothetical protein